MIYKQKIYLNVNNIPDNCFSISKKFVLDEKYILSIKIDNIKDKIVTIISVLDKNYKVLSTKTINKYTENFYNSNNFYLICKAYCLTVDIPPTTDIFKIKIFNENIFKIMNTTSYDDEIIKDEILFADFQDKFELIDISAIMIKNFFKIDDKIINQFLDKSLYFGLKSLEEIISDIDRATVIKSLAHTHTKTSINFTSNLFYERAVIGLTFKKDVDDLFWHVINDDYEKIEDLRLGDLNSYLKL